MARAISRRGPHIIMASRDSRILQSRPASSQLRARPPSRSNIPRRARPACRPRSAAFFALFTGRLSCRVAICRLLVGS